LGNIKHNFSLNLKLCDGLQPRPFISTEVISSKTLSRNLLQRQLSSYRGNQRAIINTI